MPEQQHDTLSHVHETDESVATVEMTPPHPPREETPEYARAHHFLVYEKKAPCEVCGLTIDTIGPKRAIETHHYPIERSLVDACDPVKVHADFSVVYDRATLNAFVDSPANLKVLCLTGETPVLMRDGSQKPIKDVVVGDAVIGPDGLVYPVSGTLSRWTDEPIVNMDGVRMTLNHPVLTRSGWKAAGDLLPGEVVYQVQVLSTKVVGVAGVEPQVLDPVVCPVSIDVVNTLTPGEPTPQMLLHDPAVLHHMTPSAAIPVPAQAVATGGQGNRTETRSPLSWLSVEANEPALVATVSGSSQRSYTRLLGEGGATDAASELNGAETWLSLFEPTTGIGAGGIAESNMPSDAELFTTDDAPLDEPWIALVLEAGWRPINHVECLPFYGAVYDIEIGGCHSFVAGTITVHNCDIHHRSTEHGIHHLLPADFAVQRYLLDGYVVAATKQDASQVEAKDEQIERAAGLEGDPA